MALLLLHLVAVPAQGLGNLINRLGVELGIPGHALGAFPFVIGAEVMFQHSRPFC